VVGGPGWQERVGSRAGAVTAVLRRRFRARVFCRCGGSSAFAGDVLRVPLGSLSRQKGRRYPADPARVEEIVAVMRVAGEGVAGDRMRGLIVVLWRAGLRIQEALDLYERDLEPRRGALLVRSGKGGRRREVGMDDWGWEHLSA
jgi:site-specific recombinase XerC